MEDFADELTALLQRDQGLPGKYFTDESVFHRERTAVFENSWMCIGISADAPARGDLVPVSALGHPLLMVRDGSTLRVFHNVCSHRGALLAETPTHGRPRIVCPYHSWAYKLDGQLVSTPHAGGANQHSCPQIDPQKLGLRPVRSVEWAGHVLINLSGTAPPFEEWIRPVEERFGTIPWHELRRDPAQALDLQVAANWKVLVENFVESYHLPWVHKTLNGVNPMDRHYQILGGHSYLGQGGKAYEGDQVTGGTLPRMTGLVDTSKYEALAIFPNLILAPLADMMFSIVLLPESATRTRERVEFFFVGEAALEEKHLRERRRSAEFITTVNAEDVKIVETVQRGRHSVAFTGGQFAPAQEATSLQFQKIVASHLLAGNTRRPQDIVALPTHDIEHPEEA